MGIIKNDRWMDGWMDGWMGGKWALSKMIDGWMDGDIKINKSEIKNDG